MISIVALSTTELKFLSAVLTAMDMMFAYHIMISLVLQVNLLIIIWGENTETVGLENNWSVCGH